MPHRVLGSLVWDPVRSCGLGPVRLLRLIHWLGHPENYSFSLSKTYIGCIKVSRKHLISLWNIVTVSYPWFEMSRLRYRSCNFLFDRGASVNSAFVIKTRSNILGCCDPINDTFNNVFTAPWKSGRATPGTRWRLRWSLHPGISQLQPSSESCRAAHQCFCYSRCIS